MEIKGKVIEVHPIVDGTSKRGTPWRKRGIVIETDERYPKKIYIEVWNNDVDKVMLGDKVTFDVDAESREFNGKWYTTLTAYKVEVSSGIMMPGAPNPGTAEPELPGVDSGVSDKLPFE